VEIDDRLSNDLNCVSQRSGLLLGFSLTFMFGAESRRRPDGGGPPASD
jgi:hypothetical protein